MRPGNLIVWPDQAIAIGPSRPQATASGPAAWKPRASSGIGSAPTKEGVSGSDTS